jgi:hypothetical protein
MPKKSKAAGRPARALTYEAQFISDVLAEWNCIVKSADQTKQTQMQFAKAKGVNINTMKSWIKKSNRGCNEYQLNSTLYSSTTVDPLEDQKTEIKDWIWATFGIHHASTSQIVDHIHQAHPNLIEGKGYDAKRRFAERLRADAMVERLNSFFINANIIRCQPTHIEVLGARCICKKKCGQRCLNFVNFIECNDTICNFKGSCDNRRMQTGLTIKTNLRKTPLKGWGVFSGEIIRRGTFIREYIGEVISEVEGKAKQLRHRDTYMFELRDGRYIDSTNFGNIARYFNHACLPNMISHEWNVQGQRRIAFVAAREIELGEELTFNYGSAYTIKNCLCDKCLHDQ